MTIVWSVALHGSETWALRKYERDRLEAFEMWTWCNMENNSCKDNQQTCVRPSKREKKAFKYYIRME